MKTIYIIDIQGNPAGDYEIDDGEAMPENCTDIAPPEVTGNLRAIWNGADWTISF